MKKQEDYFMAAKVTDLRSALKMLEDMSGQLKQMWKSSRWQSFPVYTVMSGRAEPLCVRPKKDRQ